MPTTFNEAIHGVVGLIRYECPIKTAGDSTRAIHAGYSSHSSQGLSLRFNGPTSTGTNQLIFSLKLIVVWLIIIQTKASSTSENRQSRPSHAVLPIFL